MCEMPVVSLQIKRILEDAKQMHITTDHNKRLTLDLFE